MKILRYIFCAILFVICMPLSWYAAWVAPGSTFITVGFSLVLPTYGLGIWVLSEFFGYSFLVGIGAFILGMVGSFISLTLFYFLNPDDT